MILMRVNFREAIRSLLGSGQRSLLALVGIVIGIGSVIGMVSIGTIVQQEAFRQFRELGIDIITIRKAFGADSKAELSLATVVAIPGTLTNVIDVAPLMNSESELKRERRKTAMGRMGVTASFFALNKLQIREGRAISDFDRNRYFCVLGAELADFLKKTGTDPILGSQIMTDNRAYTVIGVLNRTAEGGLRPYGINKAILIPITTAIQAFPNPEINMIMGRVDPEVPIARIKADIREYFEKRARGIPMEVSSAEELIDRMKKQMQMFSLLLGAIGSISLVVGGIGVMNVMLISVSERRGEIGLRRALGAQQSDIQSQFLIEAVLLCLLGGLIGIILGVGIAYLFSLYCKWQFILSHFSIMLGLGVSTAVGLFCGFYPARTAARLDPIKALRS